MLTSSRSSACSTLSARIWGFLLIGWAFTSLSAQTPTLDALILEAERNWPALAQAEALHAAAVARKSEAARAFRPNVSVGGTYTLAAGGRTIALPLGDLLNPAYSTLNQLTQSSSFPTLENQEEPLLPNNFYDARVRVSQPIFNPQLKLSRKLAAAGIDAQTAGIEVVRCALRGAVREAYYQLASVQAALDIYVTAETLTDEAYRTTASLVKNGAALPLARERIVAQRAEIQADQAVARTNVANALAQLNYLLGRPLTTPFEEDLAPVVLAPSDSAANLDASQRAELDQLRASIAVADLNAELESKWRQPRLGLQLDAGSQDFDFGLQPYALAGLSLEIPLYDGGRHSARHQRLQAERLAANAQLQSTQQGLALQVEVARNQLRAAEAEVVAFEPAVTAAERTYRDASILYRAGETGYVELLDAQNQLTTTRLRRSLAHYTTALSYVNLLQAAGR